MASYFPSVEDVPTPLGPAERVWATSETHIGMSGTFTINSVEYRVRLDLQFRDGEWKRGDRDDNWSSVYHALMLSRTDHKGDASAAARKKAENALVPWLAGFAVSEGAEIVRTAGVKRHEDEITSKRAEIERLRSEIAQAEQDLTALESA